MMRKVRVNPFRQEIILPEPKEIMTPLIYYGGKSRDCRWIIEHFPPHTDYIEVFGGGGAVLFAKKPRNTEVYNDAGNVAVFWRILQQWPEELYEKLFFTPYSRDEFLLCCDTWEQYARKSRETGEKDDYIEFARRWFVVINISYSHREDDRSFKFSVQINPAKSFCNHVDSLLAIYDRLRSIIIERLHFVDLVRLYDRDSSLLYCDPPYTEDSRVSNGTYRCEMGLEEHEQLLDILINCKSQVILSGYDNPLYNERLKDWRVVRKTVPSALQNRAQLEGRADRTEVLWIKEHSYGLWAFLEDQSPAVMARVSDHEFSETEIVPLSQ